MIVKSKKRTLRVTECKNLISQFLGLMFRNIKDDGLIFEFKKEIPVSLHMFFVFYKIDIVYLDKDKKVIKILKNIKPFTPYIPAVVCKYILELKSSKNISLSEKLKFS